MQISTSSGHCPWKHHETSIVVPYRGHKYIICLSIFLCTSVCILIYVLCMYILLCFRSDDHTPTWKISYLLTVIIPVDTCFMSIWPDRNLMTHWKENNKLDNRFLDVSFMSITMCDVRSSKRKFSPAAPLPFNIICHIPGFQFSRIIYSLYTLNIMYHTHTHIDYTCINYIYTYMHYTYTYKHNNTCKGQVYMLYLGSSYIYLGNMSRWTPLVLCL